MSDVDGHAEETDHLTVVLAAMCANFLIMIAKFVATAFTGSSAMFAEGIHSFADTGNQALLLFGNKRSKRRPDASHPFGYGQELYFWSLIVAIILFGLGGGLSVYEGMHALGAAHDAGLRDPTWNYAVLGVAFVVESVALILAIRAFRDRDRPFWEAVRQSKNPLLFVPLAEDAAALAGIVVAFLGVFLSHELGTPAPDAIASIVIGVILGVVALFLAYETRALLIGERMDARIVEDVRAAAASDPAVRGVPRVLTMHLGPNEILLNLGVHFEDGAGTDGDVAEILNRLEERIRARDSRITRIFIEPETAAEEGYQPPL